MRLLILSVFLIMFTSVVQAKGIDLIKVVKSENKMYLISEGEVVKEFDVVFGRVDGAKQKEGDLKTPEGKYIVQYKLDEGKSKFYKALKISYPNMYDEKQAKELGEEPGSDVMIHGQKNGLGWLSFVTQHFNWTKGCIALSNKDMKTLFDMVESKTAIEIVA